MKIKSLFVASLFVLASACSDSDVDADVSTASGANEMPAGLSLPQADNGTQSVSGTVSNWFFEGDAGCYGSLAVSGYEIELWAEADLCEHRDIVEGARATLTLALESDKQSYLAVAGKPVYTIKRFR